MTKRAVLYARVSGEDREMDGHNLSDQLKMCRQYALDRGWNVVAELAEEDSGVSSATMDLPKLNQVINMAEKGEFDILVVQEIDRLSRRLPNQLFIEDELERHDVAIEYVIGHQQGSPESSLIKAVRAVIAEYESLKITERMTRCPETTWGQHSDTPGKGGKTRSRIT